MEDVHVKTKLTYPFFSLAFNYIPFLASAQTNNIYLNLEEKLSEDGFPPEEGLDKS